MTSNTRQDPFQFRRDREAQQRKAEAQASLKPPTFEKKSALPAGVTVVAPRQTNQVFKAFHTSSKTSIPIHQMFTPSKTPVQRKGPGAYKKSDKDLASNDGKVPARKRSLPWEVEAEAKKAKKTLHGLSEEQQSIVDFVLDKGRNVFFTGSAGTGKSFLLRHLIEELKSRYGSSKVAVTSSTGVAACNIGGCTLHSFAGIGIGTGEVQFLVKKIQKNKKATERWLQTKVLIIDEISMLDAALMDKVEQVAALVRQNSRPFGGIQLVFTGDFFQLPPVEKKGDPPVKFAFDARCWRRSNLTTIHLTQVYRQRDNTFVDMLNDIRMGELKPRTVNVFKNLTRPLANLNGVVPTRLYSMRYQVDESNDGQLRKLSGEEVVFEALDVGKTEEHKKKLTNNCIAATRLVLKQEAQVMLIKNIDSTLVNGSRGVVVGFETAEDGSTLHWPVVRFENGRHHHCKPETWSMELPNEGEVAKRIQVPLVLSWALSIHKSQGQTLERVVVDLGTIFEKGQAYVALSRATSIAGLQVLNFKPETVMAHPRVIEFNREMQPPTAKRA